MLTNAEGSWDSFVDLNEELLWLNMHIVFEVKSIQLFSFSYCHGTCVESQILCNFSFKILSWIIRTFSISRLVSQTSKGS